MYCRPGRRNSPRILGRKSHSLALLGCLNWSRFAGRSLGLWLAATIVAVVLTATFLSPVPAQVVRQTVVVLDFAVPDKVDAIQGRKAADALAVELQRSGDYEVVTREK